ncbi:MAG: O-antigen ligase family protein [Erysipelotrichaceae bacterium]|nr:O-antigen ligase family protein [Erysipelotrichaceae bacterium]
MTKDNSFLKRFVEKDVFLILLFFSVVLILIMHDGYYDLMKTKADLFTRFMYLFLPVCLFAIVYRLIHHRFSIKGFFEWSLLGLLISSFVSMMLSYDRLYAFNGKQGWYVGFFAIFSLIAVYFALKESSPVSDRFYLVPVLLFLFECILMITDCARLDLFHLKTEFYEYQYYDYFATIGNCNWCVGCLSLSVPVMLCLYVLQEDQKKRSLFYAASLLGLLSSILNGADAIYLAYGLCFMAIIPFLFAQRIRLKRLAFLCVSVCISLLLIRVIPAFAERLSRLNGLGQWIMDLRFLLPCALVSLFVCLFLDGKKEKWYQKNRKKLIICTETIMAMIVVCAAVLALTRKDGDLGNGRLLIWAQSWKAYTKRYSWKMRFFGIGPELLNNVYAPLYERLGSYCVCSHSEPIQMLMTMGIFGLAFWLMLWFSVFATYFKSKNDLAAALSAGMIAYFGQSLVNSATIPNLVLLCLEAILLNQAIRSSERLDIIKKKSVKNSHKGG